MPKIIFQPLMIANPRNAWRGTLWGKWQAMLIIQFKVQISMLKAKTRIILLRLRCRRSCRNWWSC